MGFMPHWLPFDVGLSHCIMSFKFFRIQIIVYLDSAFAY